MTKAAPVAETAPQATSSLSTAELAFSGLPIGVFVATREGDRANPELHRIWSRPADRPFERRTFWRALEPVRRARGDRVDGDTRGNATPLAAALAGYATGPTDYRLTRDDGSSVVVRIVVAPLRQADEVVGAIVLASDETAAHERERFRDAFLGILGHELRTPITSIVGGSELLRDADLDPALRAEVAATLVDEAGRLHRLVDQLMQLANLERREDPPTEPIALVHAIRRVVRQERRRRPRLDVDVIVDGHVPPALGHEGYLDQVIGIFIDNAAKYAGSDGRIVIRVVDCGPEVEVHVLDEGPGLPIAEGDAVFRLFHRGAAHERSDRDGAGIGLFVARAILRAMGGRVWAENRPEGGADVGFALAVAEP